MRPLDPPLADIETSKEWGWGLVDLKPRGRNTYCVTAHNETDESPGCSRRADRAGRAYSLSLQDRGTATRRHNEPDGSTSLSSKQN